MRIKTAFIAALLIKLAVIIATLYILQTPQFWQFAIGQAVKRNPDLSLTKLSIEKSSLSIKRLELHNVNGRLKIKDKSYYISIGHVVFDGAKLSAQSASIVGDAITASDVTLDMEIIWKNIKPFSIAGIAKASSVTIQKYELTDAVLPFEWTQGKLNSKPWNAHFAEGDIRGELGIVWDPEMTYSVSIKAKHINTVALASVNENIFGQVKALLSGVATVAGTGLVITETTGHFESAEGGVVKAKLLAKIAQYVPQHQVLSELIKKNADIPIDQGDITFHAVSDEQWRTHVKLFSKEVNLDLNLDMDINIEGGTSGILRAGRQLLMGGQ
jgi:hypothetical protein